MFEVVVYLSCAIHMFENSGIILAMQINEDKTIDEEIYSIEHLNEQETYDDNRPYRWMPSVLVNESTPETFDDDLCKKYKRYSLYIESNDEWEFIKKFITEASHEFILETKVKGPTGLNILLGGVERFGKMNPTLAYDRHLKGPNVHPNSNSSCERYVIAARWPELSVSIRSNNEMDHSTIVEFSLPFVRFINVLK
uniref:Uncharacterized protein n=1 Tax=Elaeophora elaphi TaxID=1147741 RepID=A0A0R3S250_9BILA